MIIKKWTEAWFKELENDYEKIEDMIDTAVNIYMRAGDEEGDYSNSGWDIHKDMIRCYGRTEDSAYREYPYHMSFPLEYIVSGKLDEKKFKLWVRKDLGLEEKEKKEEQRKIAEKEVAEKSDLETYERLKLKYEK